MRGSIAAGLALTLVVTAILSGLFGRMAVLPGVLFGLLATVLQAFAVRALQRGIGGSHTDFIRGFVAGTALRFGGSRAGAGRGPGGPGAVSRRFRRRSAIWAWWCPCSFSRSDSSDDAADVLQEKVNVGEMVLHHTADACTLDFYPFGEVTIPGCHLTYPIAATLSPTKHVVSGCSSRPCWCSSRCGTPPGAWRASRPVRRRRRASPGAVEGLVLWVRNDIAIANIGHDGAKFAPLIITLFFFVLYRQSARPDAPHGLARPATWPSRRRWRSWSSWSMEIGGIPQAGPQGIPRDDLPAFPRAARRRGRWRSSIAMAPIELLGKLVKPFALAVRLFGNMTAGHFVILSLFGIVFLFGTPRAVELRHRHRPRRCWCVGIMVPGADRGTAAGVRLRAAELGVHRADAARALGDGDGRLGGRAVGRLRARRAAVYATGERRSITRPGSPAEWRAISAVLRDTGGSR